jgi:Ca2+:H+ antiporter
VILSSWINALGIFVPIGFAAWIVGLPPVVIFITNAIAIVPLSALLTEATERIANETGDSIGALLNISLGNLVELIILYVTCGHPISKVYRANHLAACELSVQALS